ncbi:MAG: kinesin, partial [Hyphomicrobiales bacterium]|nr:kinesin [Hyphomicrobiales bacterium]
MAKRTKSLDKEVAKELESALEQDLSKGAGFDISASMEDLEAQISAAAKELAEQGQKAEPAASAVTVDKAETAPVKDEARIEPPLRAIEPSPTSGAVPFNPANDDLQRATRRAPAAAKRASSTLYWIIAALSVAWVVIGAMLGHALFAPRIWQIRTLEQLAARPDIILFAVGILLPLILFWAFAVMMRRAQELRLAAQSMTDAAMRLTEPESAAQDRVMMVGQAVRREVAALGEGIERTLARAVELETLVHTEVNQLERSYSQNESRIRALVDGLGSEREAVVSHAERVRASIAGAHEALKEELSQASDRIRDDILGVSTKLSTTITSSGDSLIDRINESGGSIYDSIDQRLDKISDSLQTSGEAFASLLDTRIASLAQSTDEATRLLDERTSGMVSLLGGATRSLGSEFDTRLAAIESTLAERGQALIREFETRAEALDTGTQKLNAALEARARQINDSLVDRAKEISTAFTEGKQTLSSLIEEGRNRIGTEMGELVTSTSAMLEARASD